MRKQPTAFMALSALSAAMLIGGCGGGGSSGGGGGGGTVTPLSITTSSLPKAVINSPYTINLQATGGKPPYTWSLGPPPGSNAVSALPTGLTLSSDGTVGGMAAPGCYLVWFPQLVVHDAASQSAKVGLELDCVSPLTISPSSLPDGNIGLPYFFTPTVQGGIPPYQFTVAGGSLPPGITLDKIQALQGTPTGQGTYNFTLQAVDTGNPTLRATQAFTFTVDSNLVLPATSLPDAVQQVAYHEQIQPVGGTPPYHFALSQNASLPPGLTLDKTTGIISGTPSTSLPYTDYIYLTISDSAATPATITPFLSLNVQPPLSLQTTSLPDCARGLNYNGSLTIAGGRAPYLVSVSAGALPDGVSISSTAYNLDFNVTGIPSKDGTFPFTLNVSDSYETPNTAKQNFQIRISDPISISGPGLVNILYNQSYSTTFPVSGGIPPYAWHMSSIPPGFTFDTTTGTLSGTANGGSVTSPNVSVTDSSNPPQNATYFSFVLDAYGKLTILTTSLPPVAAGSNVLLVIPSSGGAAPLSWSISSGSLPPGLSFGTSSDMGKISGSPTASGSYPFTIALSDGNLGSMHQATSQQYLLLVKNSGQMTRNDSVSTATPISTMALLASISPFSDTSTTVPDTDFYSASAVPGTVVQVYTSPNNDFVQPPEPNSMQPVLEIVNFQGARYQTCASAQSLPGQLFNLPCVNNLPGMSNLQGNYYAFQVPGVGTTPVTFYMRVSDARGDARPDFIYTLSVIGVN